MGMGSVLPAVVIVSISVMMVVAILPAFALHQSAPPFDCPKGWTNVEIGGTDAKPSVDKNGNGHICEKVNNGGKTSYKDDHQSGKDRPG